MADQPQRVVSRPLSPHLTIYRWPITMATSIVHRMTGIGLAGGLLLLAWWLVASASGLEASTYFNVMIRTLLGQIVLFGFAWALAYHFLNGIRHLAWDFGYGFPVPTANKTGILVLVLSVLIAVAAFAVVYSGHGGYYE